MLFQRREERDVDTPKSLRMRDGVAGRRSPEVAPKVVIVGLDSASFRVMDPLLQTGELPNLSRIIAGGTRSTLTSIIPDVTPPAWTSMTTGTNPGRHGIYGFLKIRGNSARIITSLDRKSPSVWDILSENRKKVIVVNVPVTYPPWPVNGIMISDMLTPEGASDIVYPAYLSQALQKRGYKIGLSVAREGIPKRATVEELRTHVRDRMQTFAWLLQQFGWDFAMIVANEIDYAQHLFPGDMRKIVSVYTEADRALGLLIEKLDTRTTTLFVVSDHGFGIAKRAFRVNDWLLQCGAMKPAVSAKNSTVRGLADLMLRRRMTSRMLRTIEKVLPKRFARMAYTPPLAEGKFPVGLSCVAPAVHSYVPLYLNANFTNAEYEELLETVRRNSAKLVDKATGLKPILKVMSRREAFTGVFSVDAPAIILQLRENYVASEKIFSASELFYDTEQGIHEPAGILIAHGRGIKPQFELKSNPSLLDITPTVLHLLGMSAPTTLDGKVLQDILVA